MIKNKYIVVLNTQGSGFISLPITEVSFPVKGTSVVKAQAILKELNNA